MQLQGELRTTGIQQLKYRGPLHGIATIVKSEGFGGVYQGLSVAYAYQMITNGCRLGFYEPIREFMTVILYGQSDIQSLVVDITSGATSGILGAGLASPLFLVKTRLQSFSPTLPVGKQYNYKSATDGILQIYRAEGVRGWWRGSCAAMARTGIGSSVQLPVYFFAKRKLVKHLSMEEGPLLHLGSSTGSGFAVCTVMHPAGLMFILFGCTKRLMQVKIDTIMSRLYNQDGKLYKGIMDCLVKTIRVEGLFALYKGFFPHLARILPHTVLTLTFVEQTKKLVSYMENDFFLA